jgi:hypothetical protein
MSQLENYYHREPFDIVFEERNISQVRSVQILLSRSGSTRTLEEGRDYTVEETDGGDGMHVFTYRIRRSVFARDGAYDIVLMSSDQTGNSSDTTVQKKEIRFCMDRTAPECLITGISAGGVYMTGELWISLEPRDNEALSVMEVYINGELKGSLREEEIAEVGGMIRWKLEEDPSWQDIQVHTRDRAGNESWSEIIPVFIGRPDGRTPWPGENGSETGALHDVPALPPVITEGRKTEEAPGMVHTGYSVSQEIPGTAKRDHGQSSAALCGVVMAALSSVFCFLQKKIGVL